MLIVKNNDYPHSSYLSTSNKIVAWSYQVMDNIHSYFGLRTVNAQLQEENAQLRNQIAQLNHFEEDSVERSYQYSHLMQHYIPAKVIQLTTRNPHNYLTLNKGRKDGIEEGMGVICGQGVVGIIKTVSDHFSIAIPTIHTNAGVSCRMVKNNYIATIQWDGKNPNYANLLDVASHINVEEGDTLVTSGLTPIFPKDIPVGIVEDCKLKSGDSYYTIRVKLSTDFRRLDYVHIIVNPMAKEQNELNNGLD